MVIITVQNDMKKDAKLPQSDYKETPNKTTPKETQMSKKETQTDNSGRQKPAERHKMYRGGNCFFLY